MSVIEIAIVSAGAVLIVLILWNIRGHPRGGDGSGNGFGYGPDGSGD